MKKSFIIGILLSFSLSRGILPFDSYAARASIPKRVGAPYRAAIAVSVDTGEVFFEDRADVHFYPASIVKLMVLLIIQEKIEQKTLRLSDRVRVPAAAARLGGSQVYLAEKEVFSIEDLLYALIVQSANDAATALAIQVAGSPEAFVEMMRRKARFLGMTETEFHSVHGLPPNRGQSPDVSTPRDLVKLARELLRHPGILRYTSARVRDFRDGKFVMRSHNNLLGDFDGCDGLKTGYFRAAGYSIVATAKREGVRLIAVVAGSKSKKSRDAKTRELLARGFSSIPRLPPLTPASVIRKRPKPSAPFPAAVKRGSSPGVAFPPEKSRPARLKKKVFWGILFVFQAAFFYRLGRRSQRRQ